MLAKAAIYLDSNAGAPLRETVREALFSFFHESDVLIPNASSIHSHGRLAKRLLAEARERIAHSLGAKTDPEQLIFTSSGTEANQLVVRSVLESPLREGRRPHWILTPVEHDSNRQLISWLEERGGSISYFPLTADGAPDVSALPQLVRPETVLVSAIWVNNETGVVTDAALLSSLSRKFSIPLHLDAAQAWGKIPIDLEKLGAQFLTLSGHKIGGLAGTGVVWVERGNRISATLLGKQEKGRRGGTENLLGIVAAGTAASQIHAIEWSARVAPLRDRLQNVICERIPGTQVNGNGASRVANTLNLSFDGIEGEGLVMALDLAGYSVSSGSACSSGVLEPSHVLLAMGRTKQQAMAALRISLVDEMPWEVLEGFVVALERSAFRMRRNTTH